MPRPPKQKSKWENYERGASLAYKVAMTAHKVAKIAAMINVETFYKDREILLGIDSSGGSTANVLRLTNISQGDQFYQRQGDSIKAQSVAFDVTAKIHGSATTSTISFLLVRDNNDTAKADEPLVEDVLQGTYLVNGFYNRKNIGRFTVLYRRTYALAVNSKQVINIRKFKKITNHVRYDGTGVNDIGGKGHIYLMMISDQSAQQVQVQGHARFTYVDN